MHYLTNALVVAVIFLTSSFANAKDYTKDLSLPEGAKVKIISIDKKNKMIQVESVKFPAEDASWLIAKDFASSVQVDRGQKIRLQHELSSGHEKHIGKEFVLTKTINTYIHQSAFKK